MHTFKVVLVDDHEMPRGMRWAIARQPDGGMVAFMKRSMMYDTDALEDAWAAAYECQHPPRRLEPAF